MLKTTPLNSAHRASGAKMVDFGGWDMPVSYGSQVEEHRAVRRDCGMFDVSHMQVLDLEGAGVRDFLRYALANNVDKLTVPGKEIVRHGVTLLGPVNIPSAMAFQASQLYARNVLSFLLHLYDKQAKRISFDRGDEIVKGCLIAHAGEVLQGAT